MSDPRRNAPHQSRSAVLHPEAVATYRRALHPALAEQGVRVPVDLLVKRHHAHDAGGAAGGKHLRITRSRTLRRNSGRVSRAPARLHVPRAPYRPSAHLRLSELGRHDPSRLERVPTNHLLSPGTRGSVASARQSCPRRRSHQGRRSVTADEVACASSRGSVLPARLRDTHRLPPCRR